MKLIRHEVERIGADRTTVKALWRDKFRRPASVKVVEATEEHQASSTLIDGDSAEVMRTMEGFAEIAWSMGWRPAGLGATLNAVVQNFKPPKAE